MTVSSGTKPLVKVQAERLVDFVTAVFRHHGLPVGDAHAAAAALVQANLRGVDSHGVARLTMYCERLRRGVANPRPKVAVARVAPAAALVDGDDGLGLVVGRQAMAVALELARENGVGVAGVKRSGHYGMAALYVLQAVAADCIGLAFTNASPALPVWGGRSPFLGTNPLAAGVPTGTPPPLVIDMACSIVARGKLKFAAQRGEAIPAGLALDKHGRPTTNGQEAFEGVVLPFGGVKGAALALLMDVLSGVFTGAAFGGEVRNPFTGLDGPQNTGHLFMALRPDLFLPMEVFTARMQALIKRAKSQPLVAGFEEVLLPGEPEYRTELERSRSGIPLTADVVATLQREGQRLGLSLPPFAPGGQAQPRP